MAKKKDAPALKKDSSALVKDALSKKKDAASHLSIGISINKVSGLMKKVATALLFSTTFLRNVLPHVP